MTHTHFKLICQYCGTVINQCRCIHQDKATVSGTCIPCAAKVAQNPALARPLAAAAPDAEMDERLFTEALQNSRHLAYLDIIAVNARTMSLSAKGVDKQKLIQIATLADEIIVSYDEKRSRYYEIVRAAAKEERDV